MKKTYKKTVRRYKKAERLYTKAAKYKFRVLAIGLLVGAWQFIQSWL